MTLRRNASLVLGMALLAACAQATPAPTPAPATASQAAATSSPVPSATLIPPTATQTTPPTAVPSATVVPYITPDWFKTSVLYEIFVRSFYDSDGDGVGDLRGIAEKLDYIQALGANSLWLTPIFASPSYHGYDTTDYYAINPDFGTEQDLRDLVQAAHARHMHVILDYVASHTSDQHPFFKDALGKPASPYADWYQWTDAQHLAYKSFPGAPSLPSLNHQNADVNTYFVDVATHWLDPNGDGDFSDGVDGWRCDYALGSPHAFWRQLRSAVKALNPDALLLGEVWYTGPASQMDYYANEFDSLFDFPLYDALMARPDAPGDGLLAGQKPVDGFLRVVQDEHKLFPPQGIPVRFAGNHDTDRIATELDGDPARLRLAALLLATLDGTPMLYYGEEIGMQGHKGPGPVYDEYRREPMDWFASGAGPGETHWFSPLQYTRPADGISVEEQSDRPQSLLSYYRQVFALRAGYSALSHGAYAALAVTPPAGVLAYWRYTGEQIVSVVLNTGRQATTVRLDLSSAPGPLAASPRDLLTGQPASIDPQAVQLGPAQALVLDWTP